MSQEMVESVPPQAANSPQSVERQPIGCLPHVRSHSDRSKSSEKSEESKPEDSTLPTSEKSEESRSRLHSSVKLEDSTSKSSEKSEDLMPKSQFQVEKARTFSSDRSKSASSWEKSRLSRVRKRRSEQEMSEITEFEQGKWDHLLIMVNGIVGSASNWKFAAEKFKETMGDKVLAHCSACNSATLTFHGVDVMGTRLADEVQQVIDKAPGMKKISFVSHSLGGLVARYAIAKLYVPADGGLKDVPSIASETDKEHSVSTGEEQGPLQEEAKSFRKPGGTIAGLEPINFITVATPHIGSRGNQQLPFLCGFRCLEKIAICLAHWFVGRTGRHLMLTDGKHDQPPLLRRMVTDCEEGMFLSALKSFKRHVAYSNVDYDHMVGWRTSSIRRDSELPKLKHKAFDPRYPHIVRVEDTPGSLDMKSPVEDDKHVPTTEPIEEEMISVLSKISWQRVDVSFHGTAQRLFAHSTIQVKSYPLHSQGADVIQHMVDNFVP